MPLATAPRMDAADAQPQTKRPVPYLGWAGAITLVYLLLAIGDAYVAVPWCDEAWLSNPALTFLRKGYLGTPLLTSFGWGPPQSLPDIQFRTYWIMPLHMLNQIGWYKLFGYSLLSLRTLSIFWGAIGLGALSFSVLKLTGRPLVALLTMLVAGTDYFYLTRATDGRMDMMAGALMLCAFAAYLWKRERNLTLAVGLAGLCAAGSAFTHPVGGFFTLCGLGVLGWSFDRRRLRLRHAVLFAVPSLVIGSLWGIYIAQDLSAFRSQMTGNAQGRWEGISNPYWSLYREIRFKYFQAFGLNSYAHVSLQNVRLLALFTYLVGVMAVAVNRTLRREHGVRVLLAITLLFVFGGHGL